MKRVCVYPKDVSTLTGKSIRNAQKILQDLRFLLKKEKNQFITIAEFATYSGIEVAIIEKVCER
ncbi:hypothetical protein EZ428_08270 [Pedobacter frigiditerrae]|uniref:Uncharacterized protein n=1 Tax=Pedobacter frigiditerrae TaxID=2530452 RepID=A0A4R0MWV3_9SPHI|nr:hypothetical protein [Pedobacter frigiditerrae]TCC91741.1 hypothetical protein EZ428_08270 [Pedobacter frigiditerrae]